MYIYDDRSSGSQNRQTENPALLRPSQIYRYPHPAEVESRSLELGSFLSAFGEPKTLADKLRDEFKANKDKQKIFKMLRQAAPFTLDNAVRTELNTIFGTNADEIWLAETLAKNGPEPLWPLQEIKDRVKHAPKFGSDPGNYKAALSDPNPGPTLTGSRIKCIDNLKPTQLPDAFFFPGRSERRALIISGVHSDETRGVEVVKNLQALLETKSKAGIKPFFTTILVPIVFPRAQGTNDRNVAGGLGLDTKGMLQCRKVEPNRNFPLPGEHLAKAVANGAAGPDVPELKIRTSTGDRRPQDTGTERAFFVTSIRMLPETRILIRLLERFQPERLATVHDHRLKQACHVCTSGAVTKCGGEGPGLFMDPRGIDPVTNKITNQTELDADDKLARKMAEAALTRLPCNFALRGSSVFPPFAGNQAFFPLTVRYFSKARVEGNSLGDWAPVPTVGRPGIATLTIEIPKYDRAQLTAEQVVKDLHRDLLQQIFLL
jgi:hypothetical protein